MAKRSRSEGVLHYKVMELSTVDEQSLERGINHWVGQGWRFDGVQFAMRESSKRPAMAFLLFTREGGSTPRPVAGAAGRARKKSEPLAHGRSSASAQKRLRELAGLEGPTDEEIE